MSYTVSVLLSQICLVARAMIIFKTAIRYVLADTIQTRTPSMILEEPELAPSVGFVSQNLSPDVACT